MNVGKTLFAQIMEFVPWTSFARIVDRYCGNARTRRMTCAEQFRVMAFAQLTWRESLRDIEVTLGANANKCSVARAGTGRREAATASAPATRSCSEPPRWLVTGSDSIWMSRLCTPPRRLRLVHAGLRERFSGKWLVCGARGRELVAVLMIDWPIQPALLGGVSGRFITLYIDSMDRRSPPCRIFLHR
jgi:hypothetical protein